MRGAADDRRRAARIAAAIRRFDLLCLQEVFDEDARAALVRALRPTHPHQVEKVHDGDWLNEDSGLVIASRWPLSPPTFEEWNASRGWDRWADKGVVRVRVRVGRRRLTVFNLHMQSDTRRVGEAAYVRRAQVRQLTHFVGRPRGPSLIVGDFNVPGDTPEYFEMLRALPGAARDLFREANPHEAGLTWDGTGNPFIPRRDKDRLRIDYVLALTATPRVRWCRVERIGCLSDHFGVAAELVL